MNDLKNTKFFFWILVEQYDNEIFLHPEAYITKVIKYFYTNKSHMLSTSMIVRSLNVEKILQDLEKMMKNYLVLKNHILVKLEKLYILVIVNAMISILLYYAFMVITLLYYACF